MFKWHIRLPRSKLLMPQKKSNATAISALTYTPYGVAQTSSVELESTQPSSLCRCVNPLYIRGHGSYICDVCWKPQAPSASLRSTLFSQLVTLQQSLPYKSIPWRNGVYIPEPPKPARGLIATATMRVKAKALVKGVLRGTWWKPRRRWMRALAQVWRSFIVSTCGERNPYYEGPVVDINCGARHKEQLAELRAELARQFSGTQTSSRIISRKWKTIQAESTANFERYNKWLEQYRPAKDATTGKKDAKCAHDVTTTTTTTTTIGDEGDAGVASKSASSNSSDRSAMKAMLDRGHYASRFASAVYGLPFELGYFQAPEDNMKLAYPGHYRYILAQTTEQVGSVRRILGPHAANGEIDVAFARYSTRKSRVSFVVFVDHRARKIVVAFRGTLSLSDILMDYSATSVDVVLGPFDGSETIQSKIALSREQDAKKKITEHLCPSEDLVASRMSEGFAEGATEVWTRVKPILDFLLPIYPYEIVLTGHSLGAIIALSVHLMFLPASRYSAGYGAMTNAVKVSSVCLAPAPIVDSKSVDVVNSRMDPGSMLSIAYGEDLIPRMQVRSLRALVYPEDGIDEWQTPNYDPLRIPGSLVHITAKDSPIGQRAFHVNCHDPRIIEAQLTFRSAVHHFPQFYYRGILRALQDKNAY